jgi:TM2 domain-containing membrane protein YozV
MPTIPRTNDPAVIEHRLLDLAYTTDSTITAPLLAYYTPCSIEDAERVLDRLCTENRISLDVDDEGNLKYTVPNRQRMARPTQPQFALAPMIRPVMDIRPAPNPAAAAVLSMIVPGAGQLYAGRPLSGLSWFVLVTMGYMLLIIPGVLLHIICVAAAASAANQWRPSMA